MGSIRAGCRRGCGPGAPKLPFLKTCLYPKSLRTCIWNPNGMVDQQAPLHQEAHWVSEAGEVLVQGLL